MGVDDAGEVPVGVRLPVGGGLEVETKVGQLRRECGGDQKGVLLGVGEELLGQAIFVVRRVDAEGRNAGGEPADRVLTVGGVIDRRRATGGGEEAKLVQGDTVEEGKEDLAEVAV